MNLYTLTILMRFLDVQRQWIRIFYVKINNWLVGLTNEEDETYRGNLL